MIPVLKSRRLNAPLLGLICIEKILKYTITQDYRTNQLQRQCKSINIYTGKPRKNVSIKTIIRTKAGFSFPFKKRSYSKYTREMGEGLSSKKHWPNVSYEKTLKPNWQTTSQQYTDQSNDYHKLLCKYPSNTIFLWECGSVVLLFFSSSFAGGGAKTIRFKDSWCEMRMSTTMTSDLHALLSSTASCSFSWFSQTSLELELGWKQSNTGAQEIMALVFRSVRPWPLPADLPTGRDMAGKKGGWQMIRLNLVLVPCCRFSIPQTVWFSQWLTDGLTNSSNE